jgi:methyltransferase-like protein
LFPEPLEKFNLAEIKIEINDRIRKNPEWYQHYLNNRRFRRSV